MSAVDWNSSWDSDTTPWHRAEERMHPKLARHLHLMTGPEDSPKKTFLVPLCGKARDMLRLYELGHSVVGTEGSEKGCKEFFRESELEFQEEDAGKFKIFKTKDSRLRLFCGNHFDLSPSDVGGAIVDCVWDRGSLVAIQPEERKQYVEQMRSLLRPGAFSYLLTTFVFDTDQGPPYSITAEKAGELYGHFCEVKTLELFDGVKDKREEEFHNPQIDWWKELLVIITPK